MHKIILADNQAIFRAGTAKVLAMEDDIRIIAQCPDNDRLMHALDTFRGATLLFASAMKADLAMVMERVRNAGSRGIVIAENNENPQPYLSAGMNGVVFRNISGPGLIDCVRRVLAGEQCVQPIIASVETREEDMVGARVRDRLTPKEMKIVALIVQGCKNKEIAMRLGTTEQVIKNYLRSVYDKTGVSDRLELALFTIHHRILAEAAAEAGNQMQLNA
jgi:DNA-binding NarL/FixJ family response regulator